MERAKRAADAIIAALSVQSERGTKRASGSAARSSELAETPPTTAIVPCPVSSAAAWSRPTRARTIARCYDAARSARRAGGGATERQMRGWTAAAQAAQRKAIAGLWSRGAPVDP